MLRRIGLLLLLIFFATVALAQVSAPARDQTQAAVLADMSRRTGENVTINSLSSQQWYYGTYDFVRSLGCSVAPVTPTTSGNWQRFVFNYRGTDYIYMISDNLQSLILCNESSLPTAVPTAAPPTATQQGTGQSGGGFAQPSPTPQGSGQSGGGFAATATPTAVSGDFGNSPVVDAICVLPPRLEIGAQGRVMPGDANWLHADSMRSSEKIGEIPADATFLVLMGAVCDLETGMRYWQVNYNGLIGWTSEGLDGEYWLEPYLNTFQSGSVDAAFVPDWANNIPADSNTLFSLSPQGNLIAIASSPSQVDLIQLPDNNALANIVLESEISTLDFQVSGSFLTIGLANGKVHLLEVAPTPRVLAIYPHEGAITAVAASHENGILAVTDEASILTFWLPGIADAPLRRIQLPELAGDLEFSLNNRLLIVRDLEGNFLTALQVP